ncbi:MAG: SAM-dependent methyltransferase [Verrucomicrobia bacterium]|nr:SAM-dependent methyltransferase [Verrucomicrobiota bacterium]
MLPPPALARFHALLADAIAHGTLAKLTLGKPRPSADPTLRNVFARLVTLKAGPHLTLVYRHATRDITKNIPAAEAPAALAALLADTFLDAHLFTPLATAQLEQNPDPAKPARLRVKAADSAPPAPAPTHDRAKTRLLPTDAPWLRALGITNDRGHPREGMAHKYRQIDKFTELLQTLLTESGLTSELPAPNSTLLAPSPLQIADMGSGKGYLTFALATLLGPRAQITGIERRADLVALGNHIARECALAPHLTFIEGDIPVPPSSALGHSSLDIGHSPADIGHSTPSSRRLDVLIALHACDTATDDALAAGHAAGARLLVVSPCCQKELRPQLVAPPVLADALRHGIFQERQAEFITDALRALLLEAAGYRTKVFEFIDSEHTAKNLMIAAYRPTNTQTELLPAPAQRARALAAFYGIREHRLARHLGLSLT